jgi:diaminopimelate decarboxylase
VNHFEVRDGELWCEGVRLSDIAREVGTPVYVYSSATLERHFTVFRDAVSAYPAALGRPFVAYAVKANSNASVLATLAALGAGADTVSEGEIRRALNAGVPADRIVFSGVGKSDRELAFALDAGVWQINVEAQAELERLARIAAEKGVRAPVVIRVNPGVGAGGHAKITTGGATDKFGVSAEEALRLYAESYGSASIQPLGLACHIGSQITDLTPLAQAFGVMRGLVGRLRGDGFEVQRLDLGGGLGAPYFQQPDPPSPADFAAMAAEAVGGLELQYIFEPGRMIVANAGVLLTRVIHIHSRPDGGRRFLVLDAAMNDLMRPALYDAYHDLRPVRTRASEALATYDIVGPVCETGDTFARQRTLPDLQPGDLAAFMTAGAYAAVMSSEYNTRPLAPEVLVKGEAWTVARRRPSYDEIFAREPLAPWLSHAAGA